MKRQISLLAFLVLGVCSTTMAFNGEKKKKTSTTSAKNAAVAAKPSKSSSSKSSFTKVTLNDTIQSPGKTDSTGTNDGFDDLFEASTKSNVKLNAKAVVFVEDYMASNSRELLKMKGWGRPYFDMMESILGKYGLPTELKYLAVIESKLKNSAVSWAGAVGPWQLMPVTARELGLKVSRKYDERKDFKKSTHAAAKYLKDLYREFGDWLLVLAAYNGGPGNVYAAIRKSGSRNFWKLQNYLPTESRNHVKKFIGTHYIFEGQGGVTTLTKAEAKEQIGITATYLLNRKITESELKDCKTLIISGKYSANIISKNIMMSDDDFDRFNPEFDKKMAATENTYEMKLPSEKMELFNANKYTILNESLQALLDGSAAVVQAKTPSK